MVHSSQLELQRIARRETTRQWLLSAPSVLIIMLASFGPMVIVLTYSFLSPAEYGGVRWTFSLGAWVSVLLEQDIFDESYGVAWTHLSIIFRTLWIALATTILTLLIAFPTAYFIATRPAATRGIWLFLITVPSWTNIVIRIFSIQELIRNGGLLNVLLLEAGVISAPIELMYTDTAVLIGMVYVFLPMMVLPLYASLERLDFRLVEAGYDLYAKPWRVLTHVIIPAVRPGIIAGSILVFVPALGSYVVPRMLGGGTQLMISNYIDLQFGQGRNWPLGSAFSIALLIVVSFALIWYWRLSRERPGR